MRSADRQQTPHSVCSEQRIYGEIRSTATKSTKTIDIWIYHVSSIMGNLNFPHFVHFAATKCAKCAKFMFRELYKSVFWAFCTFCNHKKPKRCKIHTPKNLNNQHYQHNRVSIMLIMSIVHAPEIVSVTMRVDGGGLLESSKTSSRPSRIVTGNLCAIKAVLLRYTFKGKVIAYGFTPEILIDTDHL